MSEKKKGAKIALHFKFDTAFQDLLDIHHNLLNPFLELVSFIHQGHHLCKFCHQFWDFIRNTLYSCCKHHHGQNRLLYEKYVAVKLLLLNLKEMMNRIDFGNLVCLIIWNTDWKLGATQHYKIKTLQYYNSWFEYKQTSVELTSFYLFCRSWKVQSSLCQESILRYWWTWIEKCFLRLHGCKNSKISRHSETKRVSSLIFTACRQL